jgi:hypothetical protein
VPTDEQLDLVRAGLLAERARLLLLSIRDDELPGTVGVKGRPPGDFKIFAGIYRKVDAEMLRFGGRIVQFWNRPEEIKRLQSLRLGATHVLMGLAGEAVNGLYRNEMFTVDGKRLEDTGAIGVNSPALDSEPADRDNLTYFHFLSFAGLRDKADMVYDDAMEAARIGVDKRLRFVFDYDAPREAYRKHIEDIIAVPAMGFEEFRNYLYWYATYENATTVGTGGDYYGKWKEESPLDPRDRQYMPTKLSNAYLKESFLEYVLKKGEDYALVQVPGAMLVYHLLERTRKDRRQPELDPKLVLRFQRPNVAPSQKLETPIRMIVFHALDGGTHQPAPLGRRGVLDLSGVPSGRVVYDYKAAVRWFFAPQDYDAGDDAKWFTTFVDMLFPDAVYPVSGTLFGAKLSSLSMDDLLARADTTDGPFRLQLDAMRQLARADPDIRFVTKGAFYGETHASRRQLIGVSNNHVYEWYPETSLVTRMALADWYEQNYYGKVFNEVYESTKGMIPFMMLVTFGGVAIAGGAVIGAGAAIGALGRTAVKHIVTDQAGKKLTKEAIRKFRAQAIALVADGLLGLLPQTRDVRFEFFRGFVHGFGAGAIEHYLSAIDDRFAKQARKLYNATLSKATKGVSRAYQVYMKLSAAYHKLSGVFHALSRVWSAARAQAAANGIAALGRSVGLGFLVLLFVVVYFDYVYRSGKADKKARDEWAKAQRDLLQLMIKETGADLVAYAKGLRDDGPGADTLAVRARNDALAASIAAAVAKAPTEAPGVVEIIRHILGELGIDNVQELLDLGVMEVMSHGFDAMLANHPGLAATHARALGDAIGELIGTIFLERTILPKKWRNSSVTGNRDVDRAIRRTLAGGTSKALWELAKAPIAELRKTIPALAKSLVEPKSDTPALFETVRREETWYRDLLADLLESEKELSAALSTLAIDETLQTRLAAVTQRAATESPPGVEALLEGDDPLWPRDAMTFVLGSWQRVGLLQLLRAIETLEDAAAYGGHFKLTTLLEIAGMQVGLDDKTAAELRVTFEGRTR